MNPLITVSGLTIKDTNGCSLIEDVSFTVTQGAFLGIVGPSGSGKTTTALALLGHTRPGGRVAAGTATVAGNSMLTLPASHLQHLRGRVIAYVPQDARTALTPTMRLGGLLDEALRDAPKADRARREGDLLALAGLTEVPHLRHRFPHQLSGGQLQRFALVLALAAGATILVLDEPTSALDPRTRDALLNAIEGLRRELALTVIVITHDLAGTASRLTHLIRFSQGRIIADEQPPRLAPAPTAPAHSASCGTTSSDSPMLTVSHLNATHPDRRGHSMPVLRDVSLSLEAGSCVALVGSSGSGKTTLARCIAGLHERWTGEIRLGKVPHPLANSARQRPYVQRRRLQMVFQNPYGSLNPHRTVAEAIARPLILRGDRREAKDRVAELLEQMHLPSGYGTRYPHQLSGGERRRVAIACALASEPDVLICDEITSALDGPTQQAIADLLRDIQHLRQLTMLVITHDLTLAHALGHRIVTMTNGELASSP
ncbi:MAG: ATP-binding cassette domain-containing protein [Thermomicrobiales bacterium]